MSHPHARQTRTIPGNSGREAYMCEMLHAENVVDNVQRRNIQFVTNTCFHCGCFDVRCMGKFGWNFRISISVASCSFQIISCFFAFPLLRSCESGFQKSGCAVQSFLDIDFVLKMSSSFPRPYLCVFWHLKIMVRPNSGLVCTSAGFRLFFHLHCVFFGSPFSQRSLPGSLFQLHVGRAVGNVV